MKTLLAGILTGTAGAVGLLSILHIVLYIILVLVVLQLVLGLLGNAVTLPFAYGGNGGLLGTIVVILLLVWLL